MVCAKCRTVLQDLYVKICGVSYIGDVRMGFAEDSRKTDRIAMGSAAGLAHMYNKRLQVCAPPGVAVCCMTAFHCFTVTFVIANAARGQRI